VFIVNSLCWYLATNPRESRIIYEGDYRWLDPCCGEGTAPISLFQALGGQTYGIELDAEWSEEARAKLDHVRQGDCAAHRLPKGKQAGISALFLNPPYDQDDEHIMALDAL
jgi:tRNA1(Val) A37 N6-methylase TrmN6